jgi:hypothetical protein
MRLLFTTTAVAVLAAAAFGQSTAPAEKAAPSAAAGDAALTYSSDDVRAWTASQIDGKACTVSPVLDGGSGWEINHYRVKVAYEGEGSVSVCVLHSAANNLAEAVAKGSLHSAFLPAPSGRQVSASSTEPRERYLWLAAKTDGDVRIKEIRLVLWSGKGTVYGHEGRVFQFAGGKLPYRLMVPRNYDPSRSYPLVVSVHGSGGVGSDNVASMEGVILAGRLFTQYYFDKDLECFSLVPQIPPDKAVPAPYYPQGEAGKPTFGFHPDWPGVNENGFYQRATLALIDSLRRDSQFRIDPDRVYYTGFSYGGKGCWEFLKGGREVFAAALCGAGWPIGAAFAAPTGAQVERLKLEVRRYKHIPVHLFAGGRDGMKFGSEAVQKEIQAQGGTSEYVEFPDTSHVGAAAKIWSDRKNLLWLFSQNRKNNPAPGADPFPGGDYGGAK